MRNQILCSNETKIEPKSQVLRLEATRHSLSLGQYNLYSNHAGSSIMLVRIVGKIKGYGSDHSQDNKVATVDTFWMNFKTAPKMDKFLIPVFNVAIVTRKCLI